MALKARKTACIYLLLLSTALRQSYCQINPGFANGVAGHTSSTFKQTQSSHFYPTNYPYHAAKGYYPNSAVNSYNSYPLHGQYWTGQPHHYTKYPHYQQYPQYQHGYWNYPGSYQYYPQQFGYGHHQTGYNNYHGQYPMFDANYWMGNNYHPMYMNQAPVYMHPAPMYHAPMHYRGHQMMYHGGHYPYHAVPYPAYPYHRNYYDRGFLGGTGSELAKGLFGALLIGTVAGTVARRG